MANNMMQETQRSLDDQRAAENQAMMEAALARRQAAQESNQAASGAPAQPAPETQREAVLAPPAGGVWDQVNQNAGAVANDVGRGIRETPSAIGHGAIDAVNATFGLIDAVGDEIGKAVNFNPRLTFIDPTTGRFDLGVAWTPEDATAFRDALATRVGEDQAARAGSLPEVPQVFPEQTSVTGNLVEGMTQFMTGFVTGGRALKAANVLQQGGRAVATGRAFVAGALADLSAFDGQEERLSNIIQSVPALQNPVTEYLAASEDDPEIEGRIKNVLEGGALGVLTDGFIAGLRAHRATRAARETLTQQQTVIRQVDDEAATEIQNNVFGSGDPSQPAVSISRQAEGNVAAPAAPVDQGRMNDRMTEQAVADLNEGRRGLDGQEQEALLGAADRWAESVARLQPERGASLQDVVENARSRIDQGDYAGLMNLMEEARKPSSGAVSLIDWLRGQGGLRESADELRSSGLEPMRMRSGAPTKSNSGNQIINDTGGLDLDAAAEAASEAGYIGRNVAGEGGVEGSLPGLERGSVNDLLDALRKESGGDRVYSEQDFDSVLADAARMDLIDEVDRLGLDPNARVAERRAQAERLSAWQPGEPLTLRDHERIAAEVDAAGGSLGVKAPGGDMLGGQDIRINFNALQAPDDIRSIIGQLADAFSGEVNAARGGRRADATVITDARQLDAWNALNERRAGTPLGDSEVLAAQSLYIASAENVKAAVLQVGSSGSDMAHYNLRRAMGVHRAIQAEIAAAKQEAGRALRAWGIPAKADASSRRQLQGVLDANGGRFSDEDLARLREMMDDPALVDRVTRYRSVSQAVGEIGADFIRAAFLSGPKTHIANLAGNAFTIAYDTIPRLMAGVQGKILGDPVLEQQLGAVLSEYSGLMAGVRGQFMSFARQADYGRMGRELDRIKKAAPEQGARRTLMDTVSTVALENPVTASFRGKFDDRGVAGRKFVDSDNSRGLSAERFGVDGSSIGGRILDGAGAVLSAPTEFLGFADDFFKGINELATRHRMAFEQASNELGAGAERADFQRRMAEIIEDPSAEILDEARRVAQRRTFTEPVGLGTESVMGLRNWMNGTGLPLGHLILPFIVTPGNILKYSFMNSPAGAAFREIREDIKAGGTRRTIAESRLALGTGVLMLGMDLAANGQLTGRSPNDPAERAFLDAQGWQEYSVKLGDKYVSIRRMEPVAGMLQIGADMHDIMARAFGDEVTAREAENAYFSSLGSMMNVVMSKTYLTGVSELVQLMSDPDRYAPSYFRNQAGSVAVPTIISDVERFVDPEIRDAQTMIDRLMARTPGMSDSLPQTYDIWGRPRIWGSGENRVYDLLAPWAVRQIDASPIDAEIVRLGAYPAMPDRRISVRSSSGMTVPVDLRDAPEIYWEYVRLAGNGLEMGGVGAHDRLDSIIDGNSLESAMYRRRPDSTTERGNKSEYIQSVIERYREGARRQVQTQFRSELTAMADQRMAARVAFEQRQATEQAQQQ